MAENSYAQLIDDFDKGINVLEGETLTEYIKRMGGVDYNAHGGSVGIEVLFNKKANGGRVGLQTGGTSYDPRASVQDYANALKSVSGGTTYQQQADAKRYARQQASQMLDDAMKSASTGGSLQGIYDTFFKNKNISGISNRTFTPGGSGTMMMYSSKDRNKMLDAMSNQMLNTTSYAPAPKPRPKTYRTVSPEAQALNMSQATYEDITRSGVDPRQYYMDYHNRMMTGGADTTDPNYVGPPLLKYGQVMGGPGMMGGIMGPGMGPGATPPTQAQINQMMQNNPAGYVNFDELVKQYSSTDPYMSQKEEIMDIVDGRDTGYMSAQDYYDINVLGLDGKGIAEKYGIPYNQGGRVGFSNGGSGNWWDGLEGEALSIYNSMNAYGASDAEIQSKLQAQNLWSPDGTTTDTEQVTGIINQNIGGDDKGNAPGQGILDLTFTEGAVPRGPTTDFNINPAAQLTGKGRIDPMGGTYDNLAMMGPMDYKTAGYHMSEIPGQEGYEAPSKYFQEPSLIDKGIGSIKDFFSGLGTPRVRGTLGTRLANQPRIPFPAAMASWSRSPFNKDSPNYNENFVDQLNFLEMQDNMIGRDQGSGLLRYGDDSVLAGKNVISMFGTNDYETMLNNYIQKMNANKRISDTAKAAKIAQAKEELAALLAKQEADKKAAQPKWTPPAHHSEQGGGGYQDAPIHDIKDEGPGVTASSGMHGGKHYNTGGLATMFTRRR